MEKRHIEKLRKISGGYQEYKSFFKAVGGNEGDVCLYNTRLDVYGKGCQHNCRYCYARSLLAFRRYWNAEQPAVASISAIQKSLDKVKPGTILRLGGMTDCFMPQEAKFRVMYETIKAMNERGIGYLIITKGPISIRPDYMDIYDPKLAHFQVSITHTDDSIGRWLEEGACGYKERIRIAETLEAAGFDTQIRLSPYIPQIVDTGIINSIKCKKMLIEFMRVSHWIEEWLGEKIDLSEYTRKFHGYRHLPFERKRELVESFLPYHEVTVCDWEPEYLDFWKKKFNPNKEDCCNLRRVEQ